MINLKMKTIVVKSCIQNIYFDMQICRAHKTSTKHIKARYLYRHVNGAIVPTNFSKIWKGSNVIQVEVCNNNACEWTIEITRLWNWREVRISPVVKVSHMHATIKHYSLPVYAHDHAALSHFLSCAYNKIFSKKKSPKSGSKNIINILCDNSSSIWWDISKTANKGHKCLLDLNSYTKGKGL